MSNFGRAARQLTSIRSALSWRPRHRSAGRSARGDQSRSVFATRCACPADYAIDREGANGAGYTIEAAGVGEVVPEIIRAQIHNPTVRLIHIIYGNVSVVVAPVAALS
jgi:hypothetical protein